MDQEKAIVVSSSSEESKSKGKPLTRKQQLITAGAIFWGNIAFGCAFNTYGPTVTSLQHKYETDDDTISRVFTILTGSYMVGALSGGVIFNYVNRQLAALLLLSTMGAMMFLTPHCPSMGLFFATAAIMGLCCGSYDTAQFVWMMEMMQKDCPPYVQSQHFFYALGTSLAGLIMAPFLDEEEDDETNSTITTTTTTMSPDDEPDYDKLFIPYTIVGLMIATGVVYQIILIVFVRYYPPPPEENESDNSQKSISTLEDGSTDAALEAPKTSHPFGVWTWPKLRMIVLCCCFYGAYQGMEMCTFQFFPKFGQNSDLHLSESKSSYVLTGMTVAFAVGRAIAVVAVFKVPLQIILCVNIFFVVIANILLVSWANSSLTVLWASSILFGFGFSSIYSSFSAYVERYITFTNFTTALMIVCGSGVAAIYPLVVGNSIEETPVVLSYTSFFSIFFIILSFSTLSYLTHKNKTRYQ
ncbi:unnamed protein product [Orchesella dallaii]|uniref:Sodium-dependent glucose transporter 1 n=1 Tax=Orchesella dallaii TaxID=48710 RepID=A0ABP1Q287_9HEXA